MSCLLSIKVLENTNRTLSKFLIVDTSTYPVKNYSLIGMEIGK